MTRKKLHIFAILVCWIFSISQTTAQTDNSKNSNQKIELIYSHEYNCLTVVERCNLDILKLINYDTLIYVSSSEHFHRYEEFRGKLTKINDSIYYVKCFKVLRQEETKPSKFPIIDTLSIVCDSSLIGITIKLTYENKTAKQFKIYSTRNEFPINKSFFNSKSKNLRIGFEYLHPIVDENVEIIGRHNCDIYFGSDPVNFYDFYIVINDNIIKTLNLHNDISWGPSFYLKRMTDCQNFSRGRKLRGH